MLSVDPRSYVGQLEKFSIQKEFSENRYETMGGAQFERPHHEFLAQFEKETDTEHHDLDEPGLVSGYLPVFDHSWDKFKRLHQEGSQMTEDQLVRSNFGDWSYTPMAASMYKDTDARTYGKDAKTEKYMYDENVLPTVEQSTADHLGINNHEFVEMGAPILYE